MFQVGNRVMRKDDAGEIGTVTYVIPDDRNSIEYTLYDVQFPSGLWTLHGSELTPMVPTRMCSRRKRLSIICQKASEVYFRAVFKLADVGLSQTEIDSLRRRVEALRVACEEADERLKQHSDEHGC
jgi:hypothetical protein